MKTKLILIALAFGLMSATCETDKVEQVDCNCGVITEKITFTIPNNTFTRLTVKNNCTDDVSIVEVTGNQYAVGEEYCND